MARPWPQNFVIGANYSLFKIEKSFRMFKQDLQTRPIYHYGKPIQFTNHDPGQALLVRGRQARPIRIIT
jgi:hypothetical protein